MTATMAEYPESVLARVCDIERGLPAKSKFFPSIAEVREECEAANAVNKSPDWLIRLDQVRFETLAGRFEDYYRRGLISRETYDYKMEGLRNGTVTKPLVAITGPKK